MKTKHATNNNLTPRQMLSAAWLDRVKRSAHLVINDIDSGRSVEVKVNTISLLSVIDVFQDEGVKNICRGKPALLGAIAAAAAVAGLEQSTLIEIPPEAYAIKPYYNSGTILKRRIGQLNPEPSLVEFAESFAESILDIVLGCGIPRLDAPPKELRPALQVFNLGYLPVLAAHTVPYMYLRRRHGLEEIASCLAEALAAGLG